MVRHIKLRMITVALGALAFGQVLAGDVVTTEQVSGYVMPHCQNPKNQNQLESNIGRLQAALKDFNQTNVLAAGEAFLKLAENKLMPIDFERLESVGFDAQLKNAISTMESAVQTMNGTRTGAAVVDFKAAVTELREASGFINSYAEADVLLRTGYDHFSGEGDRGEELAECQELLRQYADLISLVSAAQVLDDMAVNCDVLDKIPNVEPILK